MAYCHQSLLEFVHCSGCKNLSWACPWIRSLFWQRARAWKPLTISFVSLTLLTCYLSIKIWFAVVDLTSWLLPCVYRHVPPCSPLTGLDGKARHSTLQISLTAGSGEGSISWRGTFFSHGCQGVPVFMDIWLKRRKYRKMYSQKAIKPSSQTALFWGCTFWTLAWLETD